jgi:ABC-2 type transport system ATP-binding protein
MELADVTGFAHKPIRALSTGMRQRVGLAVALVGDPQVLVLDEPLNGLDASGVRWLRSLIRELVDEGRAVLLASHVLAEVEQTVDRVVLLSGRVLFDGPLDALPAPGALEASYFQLLEGRTEIAVGAQR